MDERQRTVALVVVCAVAVLLTAATVVSPTEGRTGAGGSETGVGVDEGTGDPFGGGFGAGDGQGLFALNGLCTGDGFPTELFGLLGFVVGVAALIGFQRDGLAGAIAMAVVALVPVGTFVVFMLAACFQGSDGAADGLGFLGGESSGGGTGVGDTVAQLSTPEALASVLLVVAVVAALVAVIASRGGDDEDEEDDDWEVPEQDVDHEIEYDLDRIGAAAGAAADRIDGDADVSNEVYRAWREMTRFLRVERPGSSTPAEFADAAVAAGMDPDDVGELTELFEAVRYGDEAATDERARRARAALRRIERTYGGEGA